MKDGKNERRTVKLKIERKKKETDRQSGKKKGKEKK